MEYVSDVITQVWGNDKVLEAINTLNPAYTTDYANMQGVGGRNHAQTSGIYMMITDKSDKAKDGNGGKAVKAGATVPTSEFAKAKGIAEFNLGTSYIADGVITGGLNSIRTAESSANAVRKAVAAIITGIGVTAGNMVSGKLSVTGLPSAVCEAAKKAIKAVKESPAQETVSRPAVPIYKDWTYTQSRVNVYRHYPDARVPVTVFTMFRAQYRENGEQQKKPWTVQISEFRAYPKEQENGTVSYIPDSKTDETALWIKLDDNQMFDFCNRVEHFENIWEVAFCCDLIKAGLEMKEESKNKEEKIA